MKRIKITAFLFLLCTIKLFAQNEAQWSGVITELSGTVELKPAGQRDFVPAKAGDMVVKDTVVSAGFKSSARISIGSTTITVRPLTRLSLAEITASSGTETLNVNLQTGRVRVDVNPPAGTRASTSIRSPIATASVRGTIFEFDTQTLTVLEGAVAFQGSNGAVMMVYAGSTSDIYDNNKAADPIQTNAVQLMLPPLPGSNSGFRDGGMAEIKGEAGFKFILR